ncbi:MAG: diphosphokinase / guanosine-3,5-bis(diphosphate) 3-diphosphatase, partial [Nocardioidaceae bacterium]|nr:diphosphokinase / guanosine-3,5-bis(diphosphate) 3-diphosphatase [Nocardioidaceae bacterium]
MAEERVISAPTATTPTPADSSDAAAAPDPASAPPAAPAAAEPPVPVAAPTGASAGRMRTRLARIGTRGQSTNPVLEPLIRAVRVNHPKADLALLERAYTVAERAHHGQTRKSGEPYITHPLAVTTILAELGMTEATLVASLLHDTVEDTPQTLDDVRRDFGDEVAQLVDGVTKLDKVKYGESAEAETIRKMIVAMSRDIRVLVIKLADRLHNMRTLRYLKQSTQERKAKETLEIFAPLAHRLGMNTLKWELEDLAFATLHPKMYDEIVRLVADRAPSRDNFLTTVIAQVEQDLRSARIKATVTGRPKHYYSIYQKMILRGREFTDIYDLVGIRILVEDDRDCYAALGVIHSRWNPVAGRFKDFVAMPKFNMYQSLHTTVIGPHGKPVELQIRTYAMHRRAEYGIAAHWKYKEDMRAGTEPKVLEPATRTGNSDMTWVRQLLDWQQDTEDPGEFLESLRFEISSSEVYVFTPRGDVIALPTGSTPVDFAYAIHTEVGHRTIGARVNGRLVPLESALDNGDVVEVFTSKAASAGPSRDWLGFVKSPRARTKIRQWFTKERREEAIEQGKEQIARLMRKEGVPLKRVMTHENLTTVATELRLVDVSALYAAVGEGNVGAQTVVRRVVEMAGGPEGATEDLAEAVQITGRRSRNRPTRGDAGVIVKGLTDVWVKLAKCCTPVPGDDILGFVTRGEGVSVHRADCTNAHELKRQPERLVEVEWAPTDQSMFLVNIQVEA